MPLTDIIADALAATLRTDRLAIPKALKLLRDEVEARLAAIEGGTQALTNLIFPAPAELTISAGGAIAATQATHRVDTNADAASDDLDTITGVANGELILLRPENATRSVIIRDTGGGTGNIRTPHAQSITLSALTDWALGIGDGTNVTILAFRTAAGNGGGLGVIVGLLASLTTTNKTSIVAAINEVHTLALGGMAVTKRTVTITQADDLAGLAGGVTSHTKALSGGALPANARFVGAVAHTLTGFDNGGGGATYTLKAGGTDDDEIIASLNVATGQTGFPKTGTLGVRGFLMAPLAAEVKSVILTSNADLNTATAGAITVDLFYLVLA